jgi:hypothetical protein
MPSWKKVIVSGSDASLNSLNVINGITGSLLGTSSYASNANLLDGLDSTAFVLNTQTSSFVQNSQTSSFVQNSQTSSFATFTALNAYTSSINTYTSSLNAKTSSFATTGSNNFNGNQNITGSLTISSSLATELNVIGGQNITGSLNVSGSTTFTGTSGTTLLSTNADTLIFTGSLFTSGSSSFIGTQNITGSLTISSSAVVDLNVVGGQNITGSLNVSGSSIFVGNQTISGSTTITGSLGVGIAPSATNGRIDASNDVVAFSTSDIRFKENISPIPNALDKLNKIGGYIFDWKTEEKLVSLHGFKGHDVGVIAQEIEDILPEVVTTRDSGYKAVKYEKIVPLLIQAIKEQQEQIKELQDIIKNK